MASAHLQRRVGDLKSKKSSKLRDEQPAVSYEQVRADIQSKVISGVSSLLGKDNETELNLGAPLMEMGLDSLATTELVRNLSTDLGIDLPPTLLFDYPTVDALSDHLAELLSDKTTDHKPNARSSRSLAKDFDVTAQVAIVGMSCRVPGGIESPTQLWDTAASGRCTVDKVPFHRWDADAMTASNPSWSEEVKSRMHWGGFVKDLELFDASLFRISAAEANAMDPQQRLVLENSHLAFLDAGCKKEGLVGTNCGVFLGIQSNDASHMQMLTTAGVYSNTGLDNATAAGRVSFVFGLQGPCSVFDAACASSVVALHTATRCLQNGDCVHGDV